MKLNCKQGDLAVIVTDLGYQNCTYLIGSVVRVSHIFRTSQKFGAMWAIDGSLKEHPEFGKPDAVADALLRPLRDNDGTDETLTWRVVPRKVAA